MPFKLVKKHLTTLLVVTYALIFPSDVPFLNEKTTKLKIEEILMQHVKYKKITHDLIMRSFSIFLDQLDPQKVYFTNEELKAYLNPSKSYLTLCLADYNKTRFPVYEEMFELMCQAIKRREQIEKIHVSISNPKKAENIDFSKYSANQKELIKRLNHITYLQKSSIEKLKKQEQANVFNQIKKRRIKKEKEILLQKGLDRQRFIYSLIIKSIASSLDSHTNYFTPDEASDFLIQVQQRLFGIGAQFKDVIDGFEITNIIDEGPAKNCGLVNVGDKIVAVNNQSVIGMDIVDVAKMIRGKNGSQVTLTLLREKTEIEAKITRREIVLKESRYESHTSPFSDGVIAHIKLFSFYQDPKSSSSSDIRRALYSISQKHKIYGVVLDLRENGGGALTQAVAVSSLFIKKGIVVSIQDNQNKVEHLRNLNDITSFDGPLVVLTDKASASASEIVALCLQDWGRAIIVGDKTTFGKGTYQVFTLSSHNQEKINPQGEYKVTRGIYYTVGGKTPQCTGVKADIPVPGMLNELKLGEKYTSYPIENESIEANFEDKLRDIHPLYRSKVKRIYQVNQQKKMDQYKALIPLLKKRSNNRISNNKEYQQFLKSLKKSSLSEKEYDAIKKQDLQLKEAHNVLKDIIIFSQTSTESNLTKVENE